MATKTAQKSKTPQKGGKPGTAVANKKSTAVATTNVDVDAMMNKYAGSGLSTSMDENVIPLVYVLQAQSPQAQKKNPKYVEGGSEGALWLRNSANPIVDGDEGFLFQPCSFWAGWIEWKPNRGGFVARHNVKPDGCRMKKIKNDKGDEIEVEMTPSGNILSQSKEWAGFVLGLGAPMGYVIPCSGSNRAASKALMTQLNQQTDDRGRKLPSWCNVVRVKTIYRTNDKGSWYMLDMNHEETIDVETPEGKEAFVRGMKLYEAFSSGEKKAAVDDEGAAAPVGADDSGGDDDI